VRCLSLVEAGVALYEKGPRGPPHIGLLGPSTGEHTHWWYRCFYSIMRQLRSHHRRGLVQGLDELGIRTGIQPGVNLVTERPEALLRWLKSALGSITAQRPVLSGERGLMAGGAALRSGFVSAPRRTDRLQRCLEPVGSALIADGRLPAWTASSSRTDSASLALASSVSGKPRGSRTTVPAEPENFGNRRWLDALPRLGRGPPKPALEGTALLERHGQTCRPAPRAAYARDWAGGDGGRSDRTFARDIRLAPVGGAQCPGRRMGGNRASQGAALWQAAIARDDLRQWEPPDTSAAEICASASHAPRRYVEAGSYRGGAGANRFGGVIFPKPAATCSKTPRWSGHHPPSLKQVGSPIAHAAVTAID